MFRSQIDHHQGGTIFFLTSVTTFYFILLTEVAACLLLCVCWVLFCPVIAMPERHSLRQYQA
jgi:predicted membrane channel-forming protein YqfA (hemolysin III family)